MFKDDTWLREIIALTYDYTSLPNPTLIGETYPIARRIYSFRITNFFLPDAPTSNHLLQVSTVAVACLPTVDPEVEESYLAAESVARRDPFPLDKAFKQGTNISFENRDFIVFGDLGHFYEDVSRT
ncbi:hypothetical protein G7Y89_g8971 [Cudoniella acicularis]|uniref:Uncharacterized protein n=1 Tax=Cudoniella acicularis TaxID=354080 RepID=A0A8H4RFK2_9HELO|nr:hypothetical protein G7Y89_g8971 [Cudoniella acicularis]